ncbi:MAG: hypothetical protein WBC88_03435 [Candidatus Zixiibacteriota bacterium]
MRRFTQCGFDSNQQNHPQDLVTENSVARQAEDFVLLSYTLDPAKPVASDALKKGHQNSVPLS